MGIAKYSAYLSLALGASAGLALWLGLWPLAALALAFLVGGRREPVTLAADAVVFVGLAGHADPLWVALLVVATLAAREHDPRAILNPLLRIDRRDLRLRRLDRPHRTSRGGRREPRGVLHA